MSEKGGAILPDPASKAAAVKRVEAWGRFAAALKQNADKQDWEKLSKINQMMINALTKAPKAQWPAEIMARQTLANTHAEILTQLQQAKQSLAVEMQTFKSQQDGLAAYQLTQSSGGVHDR